MNCRRSPQRKWEGERLLTLRELSRELHRNPAAPVQRSHWTLRLWARKGVQINGRKDRLKLSTTALFGARYTSMEALQEFWTTLVRESQQFSLELSKERK